MSNKDLLKEYNRAREQEQRADIAQNKANSPSRQRHDEWKAEREQRRSQRQEDQKQRIADRPVPANDFPQVSSRQLGIPTKVGSQHAKAEQEYHQQKQQPTLNPTDGRRPTVSETMGRVVRPPLDDDREHKHGHSL